MRLAFIGVLAAVAAVSAGCGGGGGSGGGGTKASFDGTPVVPEASAPSFMLHDQSGALTGLTADPGDYVVVTFLYTHCPDVCPAIAGMLNRVLQTKAAERAGLRVLAVSVDPKGDTPTAVRTFVREHQLVPAFHYLTGTRAELQKVWSAFNIASVPSAGGVVSHSAFEILIDPRGQERLIYDSSATAGEVVHDLNELQGAA